MRYYISRQGSTYGPYAAEDVKRMLGEGRLLASDLCWREGMAGWEPLGQLMDVAAGPAAPPTPPALPPRPAVPQPPAAAETPRVRPGQGYAARPTAEPARQAPGAAAAGSRWPSPPELHWAAVLLLSWVTCGIFALVWFYKQAAFVKKLSPGNPAIPLILAYITAIFMALILPFLVRSSVVLVFVYFLPWAGLALMLTAVFSMRSALLRHYNAVENIGLRLSLLMTFFFNILYFHYHFSRINRWKLTGRPV